VCLGLYVLADTATTISVEHAGRALAPKRAYRFIESPPRASTGLRRTLNGRRRSSSSCPHKTTGLAAPPDKLACLHHFYWCIFVLR